VCIEDRLDPDKMAGVYPPSLKTRGDYAGDIRKVPCTKLESKAADQIFPLIVHENFYTPTVKHHCPRTAVSSSLRACSNKVGFDPIEFDRYAKWFRSKFIPEFMKCVDRELWEVKISDWLLKYDIPYRKKMLKAIDRDHISANGELKMQYEAFTKIEMQFTTVPHDWKDTPLNDTKERQICGPVDEKKVWANAFINKLEEIASKYKKGYCGRANWIEICEKLDALVLKITNPIWGASDGKGFDMTQLPEYNALMDELILAAAEHPNFSWEEPLELDRLKESLQGSHELNVSVDHGDLKYKTVGRASGDGWTTFSNTMLMLSYWEYTYDKVAIEEYILMAKGDDTLFCHDVNLQDTFLHSVDSVFTNRSDEHKHGLGQIVKKIKFGDLTDLDFLSNEFFLTSQGKYRMTRIPARVFQTLSWTTKLPKEATLDQRRELCYSKGKCLEAWASNLPIFGKLAKKMIELGKPGKLSCYDQYSDGGRVWYSDRDDYDQYCYYLEQHYQITRAEITEVEKQIDQVKLLSGVLKLPQLEKIYAPFVEMCW
jgi:hypothetical protein